MIGRLRAAWKEMTMVERERPRVRVGIVGAGFVARLHAEGYRHVHGVTVDLRAVTAVRPERARAFAAEAGAAAVVSDFRAILDNSEVDVVDLCVPSHLHAAMALDAAAAGKHVIVEKPLTGFFGDARTPRLAMLESALASADQVIRACRTAGVRLCYGENWVYAPPVQKARRLVTAAGGPILRIVGEESHSGTHAPINKRWETGGGGSLIGKGCHPLGAALFLKADEGRRLHGAVVHEVSLISAGRCPAVPQPRVRWGRRRAAQESVLEQHDPLGRSCGGGRADRGGVQRQRDVHRGDVGDVHQRQRLAARHLPGQVHPPSQVGTGGSPAER